MATAALAFVGAATMFVLPDPRITVETGGPADLGQAPPRQPPKNPADGVRTDWPTLASSLGEMNSPELDAFEILLAERREAQETMAAQGEDPEQPTTKGGFAPPWRFIGTITEAGGLSALVEIDMKQRFLRPGYRSPDGYELISVSGTEMVIAQGRTRHTIRREANTRGESLNVGSVFAAPGVTPGMPPDLNEGLDAVDPEFRRRRAGGER